MFSLVDLRDNDTKKSKESNDSGIEERESVLIVGDLEVHVSSPKRVPFVKKRYKGRETISASIPGWLKAALDYIASTVPKYKGFGGKSKFLSEAIESKLMSEFPKLYAELKKLKKV